MGAYSLQNVAASMPTVISQDEIRKEWLDGINSVGICGATSTPKWLMELCAAKVKELAGEEE